MFKVRLKPMILFKSVVERHPAVRRAKGLTLEKTTLRCATAVLASLCMLVGCDRSAVASGISTQTKNERSSSASTSVPASHRSSGEMVAVMVDHVSYRHDRSMKYTLLDMRTSPPQPVGGAIVDRLSGGGEKSCCVNLPKTWRPGINLRVTWTESDRDRAYPEKYVKDIQIPKYDEASDLYVVFYPNHEVELVVSVGEPGHPDWKGRIKQTPWDACVQEVGRKTCKRAIPNYGGLSESEMRGLCVRFKAEGHDDNCTRVMDDCVKYYEDNAFCEKLLWDSAGNKK